jgi:hypothetical protein
MPEPEDKPLKVVAPFDESGVVFVSPMVPDPVLEPADEPLEVVADFVPGIVDIASGGIDIQEDPALTVLDVVLIPGIGIATGDPDTTAPDPPTQSVDFAIRALPPDGEVFAFSSDGSRDAGHYDSAHVLVGADGKGAFTFKGGFRVDVDGRNVITAAEVRTSFKATLRDIRGVGVFPRNGQVGKVTLTDGPVSLIAKATLGHQID